MLDDDTTQTPAGATAESGTPVVKTTTRKRTTRSTAKKTTAAPAADTAAASTTEPAASEAAPAKKAAAKKAPAKKAAAKKAPAKKAAAKKAPAKKAAPVAEPVDDGQATLDLSAGSEAPAAEAPVVKRTTRKRTTKKTAAEVPAVEAPAAAEASVEETPAPAKKAPAKRTRKTAAKKVAPAAEIEAAPEAAPSTETATETVAESAPVVKRTTRKRTTKKAAAAVETVAPVVETPAPESTEPTDPANEASTETAAAAPMALFQVPTSEPKVTTRRRSTRKVAAVEVPAPEAVEADEVEEELLDEAVEVTETVAPEADAAEAEGTDAENAESAEDESEEDEDEGQGNARRRRRRGGRRRRRSGGNDSDSDTEASDESSEGESDESAETEENAAEQADESGSGTSRRRRRRRRAGDSDNDSQDDPENTVTRVRKTRALEDQITAVSGSTRLEAKKQRRREGREAGRRRAPIISEAEFLARREAVDRQMVIRQREELTQIGVLEDKVLVEHYVARESQTSMIGNVYLGRVQNVLPSMEAAFIDIGKGRNAVLYAGEVNWAALGHKDGAPRKIESVLSSGQSILVQVTKDPIGHKGARLTSQVSLAGRFLVYVPDGTNSGISRKLPDTERTRLKKLLKEIVPEHAGVIVRTAAEGASEEELTRDVERLKARWADIEAKVAAKTHGPVLLYGEPDLTLKVVRDLFTEDFSKLIIEGDDAWETVQDYVTHVAPDLLERVEKFSSPTEGRDAGKDIFGVHRIEEQIHKGLDRKVWLPSGGSLIIDRTEAMTVIDVNTGKFTGSGGNLEETVTKNNLEAAEEVVRQLRLRDIGGIIVVDFIDMVLESNRDLVVRRLVECLGRDRTRHQVAEVTSLGLVQMTRKRIGTGLLETFGVDCDHCHGRGMVISDQPVEPRRSPAEEDNRRGNARNRRGKGRSEQSEQSGPAEQSGTAAEQPAEAPAPAAEVAVEESATVTQTPRESGRGRNRRRSNRGEGSDRSAEPVAAVTEVAEVADVVVPEPVAAEAAEQPVAEQPVVEQAVVETVAEPVVEEAAPKLTRRSRRRANVIVVTPSEAPVAVDEAPAAEVGQASTPSEELPEEPVAEAEPATLLDTVGEEAAAAVETVEAAQEAPAAPGAPKVVTRTRRRAANRPAGPPASEAARAAAEDADEDSAEASAASGDGVAHVPLKKKGSRKR